MRRLHYILVDDEVAQCSDHDAWLAFIADIPGRTLAEDRVGSFRVLTTFMGIDHGFGAVPLLWETAVYGADVGWRSPLTRHYASREEATRGHNDVLAILLAEAAGTLPSLRIVEQVRQWARPGVA